jgi:hypothetical protein
VVNPLLCAWRDGGVFETAMKQVLWFALKEEQNGSRAVLIVDIE